MKTKADDVKKSTAVDVLPNQISLIDTGKSKKAETKTPATNYTYTAEKLAEKLEISTARLSQLKKEMLEREKDYYFNDDREIVYYQSAYNIIKKRPVIRKRTKKEKA